MVDSYGTTLGFVELDAQDSYGTTLGFMELDAQAVFPLSTSEGVTPIMRLYLPRVRARLRGIAAW